MTACQKCLENNWKIEKKRDSDDDFIYKWVEAKCNICGNRVDFGHKKSKLNKIIAEYKILFNRRFLKIDGEFKEVELEYNKKGHIKIVPAKPKLL